MSDHQPERERMTAAQAQRRSADLLEQAFATQERTASPWGAGQAPEIMSVLPESERLLYIMAGQAYATLALSLSPGGGDPA